jgi:hypothetical protein
LPHRWPNLIETATVVLPAMALLIDCAAKIEITGRSSRFERYAARHSRFVMLKSRRLEDVLWLIGVVIFAAGREALWFVTAVSAAQPAALRVDF